jgi:hypothetical protein
MPLRSNRCKNHKQTWECNETFRFCRGKKPKTNSGMQGGTCQIKYRWRWNEVAILASLQTIQELISHKAKRKITMREVLINLVLQSGTFGYRTFLISHNAKRKISMREVQALLILTCNSHLLVMMRQNEVRILNMSKVFGSPLVVDKNWHYMMHIPPRKVNAYKFLISSCQAASQQTKFLLRSGSKHVAWYKMKAACCWRAHFCPHNVPRGNFNWNESKDSTRFSDHISEY